MFRRNWRVCHKRALLRGAGRDTESVGYSEYFKSQQTGKLVEAKYEVHKADYGGEDVVEVNGRRYFVLKTYDTGTDTIELTLTDLRHRNEV